MGLVVAGIETCILVGTSKFPRDFLHVSEAEVSFFCHALLEHRNTASSSYMLLSPLPDRQVHVYIAEEQFDVFIYNNASREDDKTELFKSLVPGADFEPIMAVRAPCPQHTSPKFA